MDLNSIINMALVEDIGRGDITTESIFTLSHKSTAYIICKQHGVISGLNIAVEVFRTIDNTLSFVAYKKDGDSISDEDDILKITGKTSSILKGERVALNFLQRLSGISTTTRNLTELIKPFHAKLLDTRKTTPLLRNLEKYAVKVGGGFNHRFGLYDMIMIKDNHIEAAGSITNAVDLVKKENLPYKIEVEVKNMIELEEAFKAKVDRIMLDNMPYDEIQLAVDLFSDKVELEASGNITEENINKIASTGIHYISTGKMTHSFKSIDLSLIFRE